MKPAKREEGTGWVILFRAPDEWRAEMVRELLLDATIPAIVNPHGATPYADVFAVQALSWGDVLVPARCEKAARALLDAMFSEQE